MGRERTIALLVAVCVSMLITACSGNSQTGFNQDDVQTNAGPTTPAAPSELHLAAYTVDDLELDGSEYRDDRIHNRVSRDGTAAVFSPDWSGGVDQGLGLATAMYVFSVEEYDLATTLHLDFSASGEDADGWVALADFNTDSWDWSRIPADGALAFDYDDHISTGGGIYILFSMTGTAQWRLEGLSLGDGDLRGAWPMYGCDRQNTCQSDYVGCQTGNLKWVFKTYRGGNTFTEAVAAPDGTVYTGCGTDLHALNPDGSVKWVAEFCYPYGKPVLADDGTIYVGELYGPIHAIDPEGNELWETDGDIYSDGPPVIGADGVIYSDFTNRLMATNPDGSQRWVRSYGYSNLNTPALGPDGTIYCSSVSGILYAVDQDGRKLWEYDTEELFSGAVCFTPSGLICFGTTYGVYYAFNTDGTLAWTYEADDGFYSTPIADADRIYLPTCGRLLALSPAGELLWEYETGLPPIETPTIGPDGNLYVSRVDNTLHVLQPDGTFLWSYTDATVSYRAEVTPEGRIYTSGGYGKFYAIDGNGDLLWTYTGGGKINSSPVLAADGTVFFGCHDRTLYAINPDGTERWNYPVTTTITSDPAVTHDGSVLFSSHCTGDMLYACDLDGTLIWDKSISGNVSSSLNINLDGSIWVGSGSVIYSFEPTGHFRWSYRTELYNEGSPAIGHDGTVYHQNDYKLYALNRNTGVKWIYDAGVDSYDHADFSPVIGPDDTVYMVSGENDERLHAVNPDGTARWVIAPGEYTYSSPALGADGTLFIGADHALKAFDLEGNQLWEFEASIFYAPPAIGADGTLYAGCGDSRIYALNPDGSVKWEYQTGSAIKTTPAIAADGTVYITSTDGRIYAFGD